MDISKEYIKMADCPEIQAHGIENGDYVSAGDEVGIFIEDESVIYALDGDGLCYGRKQVWLPSQDQLQDMYITTHDYKGMATIKDEASFPQSLIHSIWFFAFETDGGGDYAGVNEYAHQFTSMEQLWLAIAMQMKHNKTWNGTEWQ